MPGTTRSFLAPRVLPVLGIITLLGPAGCRTRDHAADAAPANVPSTAAPAITGRVVDAAGHPLAGVPVRMYAGLATRWCTGETTTGPDGRFAFAEALGAQVLDQSTGRWRAYVGISAGEPGEGNPAEALPWTDVTVAPDESAYVELVLAAHGTPRDGARP